MDLVALCQSRRDLSGADTTQMQLHTPFYTTARLQGGNQLSYVASVIWLAAGHSCQARTSLMYAGLTWSSRSTVVQHICMLQQPSSGQTSWVLAIFSPHLLSPPQCRLLDLLLLAPFSISSSGQAGKFRGQNVLHAVLQSLHLYFAFFFHLP